MKRLFGVLVVVLFVSGTTVFAQTAHKQPVAAAAKATAKPATQAGLTNAQIIRMVGAGLSDDVVIASIESAKDKSFDLSPDGLIGLKSAHVSDAVILAMQGKSPAPPPPPKNLRVVEPEPTAAAEPTTATAAQPQPKKKWYNRFVTIKKDKRDGEAKPAAFAPSSSFDKQTVEQNHWVEFAVPLGARSAFDKAKLHLVSQPDMVIEQANAETMQIVGMQRWRKGVTDHESRTVVTILQGSRTTIRVAVSDNNRKRILQADRWKGEKFDADLTIAAANRLMQALGTDRIAER